MAFHQHHHADDEGMHVAARVYKVSGAEGVLHWLGRSQTYSNNSYGLGLFKHVLILGQLFRSNDI